MNMYALFHYAKQISKPHKHKICAIVEAYERGIVMTKIGLLTGEGYIIRALEPQPKD